MRIETHRVLIESGGINCGRGPGGVIGVVPGGRVNRLGVPGVTWYEYVQLGRLSGLAVSCRG